MDPLFRKTCTVFDEGGAAAYTTDENFAESLVLALLETHLDHASAHLPPGFTRLLCPKVTRLPGEVGVAEYMMLSSRI